MPDFRLNIVLNRPEIPQNTGSIGRLCVNLGIRLHLVRPLGFSLAEKQLKRAGLDYWPHLDVLVHDSWEDFLETEKPGGMSFLSTKATKSHFDQKYRNGAYVVFGRETSGLPPEFYDKYAEDMFQIPMPGKHFRSLNLSNSVSIVAYEAYRQWLRSGETPGGQD